MFLVNQNNACVFSFKKRMWNGVWLKPEVISVWGRGGGRGERQIANAPVFPSITSNIITVSTSSFCSYSQIFTGAFDQASSTTRLITEQVRLSLAFAPSAH